jgi:PAP2 superfamily protein
METGPWSDPAVAELAALPEAGTGAAQARARRLARALLRELRFGWTSRCLALALSYVAVGYLVAAGNALPLHWPIEQMLVRQIETVFLLAYVPLVLAFFAGGLWRGQARCAFLRSQLFSPRFAVDLLAAMLAVHLTLIVFVNLKQYVPAINERLYDSPLWRLDEWLHAGFAPSAAVSDWAGEHGWLDFLDQTYLIFFPVQVVVPLCFLLSRRLRPQRGRFFFAYCLLWIVGSLVYALWPSLGPTYYRSSRFLWLDAAPYAQHLQYLLMQDYVRFRTDPSYYDVKLYYGVAAMPSLHVAVVALFAIATQRWRGLALAMWAITALTFVGSLALGWHYAVDGYAGALIAWGCWVVARRVIPLAAEPAA